MKILFISYYGWLYGGGETYLFALRDALQVRGHEVRVFSSNNGESEKVITSDYTFKVSTSKFGRTLSSLYSVRSALALRKVLADFSPDIVHINSISNEVSPSVTLNLKKYSTVMSLLSKYIFMPEKDLPTRDRIYAYLNAFTRRFLIHNVDMYLTPSKSMISVVPNTKQPLKIVPIGIKPLLYSQIKNYDSVLFTGRLTTDKGVDVLIEAMRIVVTKRKDITLRIIGDGPERVRYEQLCVDYGLQNNIYFIGYVENKEITKYLDECSIFVMPSTYEEPFGLSGIEALFVGRPVIGSKIGGIPEWLNNLGGRLVEPGNPLELAEKILLLLSSKQQLKKLSLTASQTAQKYSIDSLVLGIETIYTDILLSKGKSVAP
jgi:glycosyltransferase involved in cell wall biosynthesis